MKLILDHEIPDDFVIATGQTHTVRELTQKVFQLLDLDYRDFVVQNPKYFRPEELPYLRGDASKARSVLGWSPEVTFDQLIEEMVDEWMLKLRARKG
jgi:GDPmannose 4,6-dehydratase